MKALFVFLITFVLGSLADTSNPPLILPVTIRDFSNADSGNSKAHPDFNSFLCGQVDGIVKSQLGSDNKPVYNDGHGCVTSEETFDQWWRTTDWCIEFDNFPLTLYWDPAMKAYSFNNQAFFPIDGQGFGNENGWNHNFGFCLEAHATFTYQGGETFNFMGDDDIWVFIAGNLVVDLGGVHTAATGSVTLDSLGLTIGQNYPLDIFFCERHTSESHCIFSTDIELSPCGTVDSDGDGIADLCDDCPKANVEVTVTNDPPASDDSVTFHIAVSSYAGSGYEITFDFGDGKDPQVITATTTTDYTYKYSGDGDYTVTWQGAAVSGCGTGPSGTTDITCGGQRIAPKCSEISAEPIPGKRKRSLSS